MFHDRFVTCFRNRSKQYDLLYCGSLAEWLSTCCVRSQGGCGVSCQIILILQRFTIEKNSLMNALQHGATY